MYALYLIVLYISIDTAVFRRVHHYRQGNRSLKEIAEFNSWAARRYQVNGITKNGKECMDNCVGTCRPHWEYWQREACAVIGNRTAPVYFTARKFGDRAVCAGNCGKFGYNYYWCLVEGDTLWEYCSAEIYKQKYKVHLTDSGLRCTTPCQIINGHKYLCKNAWDELEHCDPSEMIDYIPERTIYGYICVSSCYKRYKDGLYHNYWNECYDINRNYELCAPSAQSFGAHMMTIYDRLHYLYKYKDRTDIVRYKIPYE